MNLSLQHRLASEIFKCGQRKVWLDPKQQDVICKAKTRSQIRDLIGQDIIQHIPSHRGKRDGLTKMHQNRDPKTLKLRAAWKDKVLSAEKVNLTPTTAANKAGEMILEEL